MSAEERTRVLQELNNAVLQLAVAINPVMIPHQGIRIGYALEKARENQDVSAVKRRPRDESRDIETPGELAFGADDDLARMVLTAMRFDPAIRSAAVVRYDPAIVRACEDLFFDICHFDRRKEPPGIRTMEWGIASCCRDGVPDVIYDEGGAGKEAMIRFFGENPVVVANNIIKVSGRII